MDALIAAYLDYHLRDGGNGMPVPTPGNQSSVNESSNNPAFFNIELVDLFHEFLPVCVNCLLT
jgi:hypothetical protein